MDRSSPIMLSSLLIHGIIPSALNVKWVDMPALCHQTGLTKPTTVGFPPHMMKITPFLVDAPVDFPTQMTSHAITCLQWSGLTQLRVSMRQMACQYGGILAVGTSSILLILLYGLLLTNLFAIQQLLQNQTKSSPCFVNLIQQGGKVEDHAVSPFPNLEMQHNNKESWLLTLRIFILCDLFPH